MKPQSVYALAGCCCALFAAFLTTTNALAQNTRPAVTLTPDQVYEQYQTDPMFLDKYKGKTIEVTGVIHSATAGGQNLVRLKTSPSTPVTGHQVLCVVPAADRASLALLRPNMPVKATGVFVRFTLTFGGTLDPCAVTTGPTGGSQTDIAPAKTDAPKDAPLGEYAVYQMVYPRFSYQYRFALIDRSNYSVFGKREGTYAYNPRSKTLSFQTGKLKEFVGLYYTQGRNANGPTIALDPNGRVPNLERASLSQYQYAYYRPQGVK